MFAYLLIIVASLVIGFAVQGYCRSQLSKYERVPSSLRMTGAQVAQAMLAHYGVQGVSVGVGASGNDHFDPRTNSIALGPESYSGSSITAVATACHEVGHACQLAQGYKPFRVRSALVPVVNFTQQTWMIILLVGVFLNVIGLVDLAIIFYAFAVIFQLVTLPVEFNASRRAIAFMSSTGIVAGEQQAAFSVLRACALTYVGAALVSVLNLLYLLSLRDE